MVVSGQEAIWIKDFTAPAMAFFYLITSILTGYMLYLHIAGPRSGHAFGNSVD